MVQLLVFILLLMGWSAQATTTHLTTCYAESNTFTFSQTNEDPSLAKKLAVQQCENERRTSNYECDRNFWCGPTGTQPPEMVTCSTISMGFSFTHRDWNHDLAEQLVVEDCEQYDAGTLLTECQAEVTCTN